MLLRFHAKYITIVMLVVKMLININLIRLYHVWHPLYEVSPVSHLLILPGIFYRLGTVIVAEVQVWFFLLPYTAVPTAAQIPWRVSAMHTDVFIPVYFLF